MNSQGFQSNNLLRKMDNLFQFINWILFNVFLMTSRMITWDFFSPHRLPSPISFSSPPWRHVLPYNVFSPHFDILSRAVVIYVPLPTWYVSYDLFTTCHCLHNPTTQISMLSIVVYRCSLHYVIFDCHKMCSLVFPQFISFKILNNKFTQLS